jgi:hypothetical protein
MMTVNWRILALGQCQNHFFTNRLGNNTRGKGCSVEEEKL